MTLRVLDFGRVSPIGSQAIYHGLADALAAEDAPDPVQSDRSLHLRRCLAGRAAGDRRGLLPVPRPAGAPTRDRRRRRLSRSQPALLPLHFPPPSGVGGKPRSLSLVHRAGAANLSRPRHRGPLPADQRHPRGRPQDRRDGAARIGEAVVLGGSFLFDFDVATMVRCLKIPSEKFRDKLATTLEGYMTTMARLLPAVPPRALVKQRYLDAVAEWLGEELVESNPTPAERAAIAAREKSMSDPAFIHQFGRRRIASGIKIAAATHLTEGACKAPGGLIRAVLLERDGTIADLDLSGDFTCLPASGLLDLAARLRGAPVEEARLSRIIARAIADLGLDLPGVTPADLARAIVACSNL